MRTRKPVEHIEKAVLDFNTKYPKRSAAFAALLNRKGLTDEKGELKNDDEILRLLAAFKRS